MPVDAEVARELWQAQLPVEFVLASQEIKTVEKAASFYLLVPRMAYFPFVYKKLCAQFDAFVDNANANGIWLEYDGVPLKWHQPVGLLFDTMVSSECLPWTLTVHFQDFPADQLLEYSGLDCLRSNFTQLVKEADQLKHKASIINGMQEREHALLWNGLLQYDFDKFWKVNRQLMVDDEKEPMRYVPLRIYLKPGQYRQVLVSGMDCECNERTTLQQLIADWSIPFDTANQSLISQGVPLPTDTPLIWMAENLAYADNFVHLCIVDRPNDTALIG